MCKEKSKKKIVGQLQLTFCKIYLLNEIKANEILQNASGTFYGFKI